MVTIQLDGGDKEMRKLSIATICILVVLAVITTTVAGIKESENAELKEETTVLRQQLSELEFWTEGYYQHRIIELEKAEVHVIYDAPYDAESNETKLRWLALIHSTHNATFRIKIGFSFESGEEVGITWYEVEADITRWVSNESSVSGDTYVEGVSVEILALAD